MPDAVFEVGFDLVGESLPSFLAGNQFHNEGRDRLRCILVGFGESGPGREIADGWEEDAVGTLGNPESQVEAGVALALFLDVCGESLRKVEDGRTMFRIGRVEQNRNTTVQFGPLSRIGQLKTCVEELRGGHQLLKHDANSDVRFRLTASSVAAVLRRADVADAYGDFGKDSFMAELMLLLMACGQAPERLPVRSVVISLVDDVEVPVREAGVLTRLEVSTGVYVDAGQLLAVLDDGAARLAEERAAAELAIARLRAESRLRVELAEKTLDVASTEVRRAEESNAVFASTVSETELDQLRLNQEKSRLELEQALQDLEVDRLVVKLHEADLAIAQDSVERRRVVAPLTGKVVRVDREAGEWIQPGEPLCRIVGTRRVRAEGFLSGDNPAVREGAAVTVRLADNSGALRDFVGEVVFVDPEINAVNGQYRIWAEVENPDGVLRPGHRPQMWVAAGMSDPHTEAILPFRRRPDLVVARQGNSWTLKDPLTLKYFSLQQAEYFVWSRLNGRITLQDVIQEFERLYTPQRLTAETVTSFLVQLWRQGLLLLDQPGQSVDLAMRARIVRSARRGQSIQNLLAIRFRGIDPDRFLARIMPFVGWLVSWPVALLGLVFVLFAVSIILGDWDRFMRELPSIQTFLQADRILWLAATLACVKGIHELGHAITCKRFGGECRELGVMLLAFTPCLYCNVSDAWLLADRRHRVLISAAGIMVELFLAAMAVFVWVSTVPGIVHSLAMYVILICSLNTVLLNGNPLLRYDGYYVLSDAIGVPNLRERSQQIFRGALAQWTLGVRDISPRRITAGRLGIGLYGAASSIYVWVVIAGILWLFYRLARPHDLQGLVILLAITVVGSRL
ncbi:Peptidase family M50, partial [Durusdinium trenchii]